MADTSDRIILLSALILVGIIVWTFMLPTIVSLSDIQIELETDKTLYLVDEEFTVKVSFYNEKSYTVRINTNIDKDLIGYTLGREGIPALLGHGFPKKFSKIPPNSRIEFYSGILTPKYSGDFLITCLGANKSVQILEPVSNLVDDARDFIVEIVGEDYFNEYFTYWGFETGGTTESWRHRVGFFYNIQVGNYTEVSETLLFYDSSQSLIRHTAVPSADNLMPFNVTMEEAVVIATEEAESLSWVDINAQIYYRDESWGGISLEKYVWVVSLYRNPRKANSGSLLSVFVDPHNGTVYESELIAWMSTP